MKKSYDDFKVQYLSTHHDVDKAYGYQCWDGAMFYSLYLGYKVYYCWRSRYAKDIYNLRLDSGILKEYKDMKTSPRRGAIVVFKECKETPKSHIGIIDKWNSTEVKVLAQNQNGRADFNLKWFKRENILGVLYPRCFIPTSVPEGYLKARKPGKPYTHISEVKKLQECLNYILDTQLTINGHYGPKTEEAVKRYQKMKGIKETGRYGDVTRAKLREDIKR